jgi:hypothetical protein
MPLVGQNMKFRLPTSALLAALTFSLGLVLLAQQSAPTPKPAHQPKGGTVYVTHTGKYYHRENCRYWDLAKTKIPIALKDAKQRGYTACKVCRPAQ